MTSVNSNIYEKSDEGLELGFSLLEMLIALAIMSLTSLVLSQSIGTMLSVSERAVSASERTLEVVIERHTMSKLIDGLVPQWGELTEGSFSGRPQAFSALSANSISSSNVENAEFTLSLQRLDGRGKILVFETKVTNWIVESDLPDTAYFEYLGPENTWHKNWPIAIRLNLNEDNPFSNLQLLSLPQAIRLNSSSSDKNQLYVVERHYMLPDRMELLHE